MSHPGRGVVRSERATQRVLAIALLVVVILAFGIAGSGVVAAVR